MEAKADNEQRVGCVNQLLDASVVRSPLGSESVFMDQFREQMEDGSHRVIIKHGPQRQFRLVVGHVRFPFFGHVRFPFIAESEIRLSEGATLGEIFLGPIFAYKLAVSDRAACA